TTSLDLDRLQILPAMLAPSRRGSNMFNISNRGIGIAALALLMAFTAKPAHSADENRQYAYAVVGSETRAPIGWVQFCQDYRGECAPGQREARDVVLTQTAWRDLVRINRWANETI